MEIRKELIKLSDKKYANFNSSLCPDTHKEMLGVRIPELRKLAQKIIKEYTLEDFLNISQNDFFEEILLEGLVIAYYKTEIKNKYIFLKKYIPKMDSWAITDTVTPTLKIKENEKETYWKFISNYFYSDYEFECRFSIISMLDYFINDDYIDNVIKTIDSINNSKYYVQMAKAWTLAEIGIKYNKKLMTYLQQKNNLDKFTYNKTLQKLIESYRVSEEQKVIYKKMKK